nr:RNA-directed DNA polymerase, eukaryota, reverse transcriptase zinc-binding domain protein [Tanacetum cinerariifolium]
MKKSEEKKMSEVSLCRENEGEDQVQDLERIVTYEEVEGAVWDCGTNKSPGPDGFSFEFYRKYWTTIDDDVDFEKAFDSMTWDYLDETLKAFGFGSKWRNWISSCLNNAMGSVLVNGSPTLEFQFHKVFIGEWNNNNIQTLLSVLRCFYLASCLKINLHKSKLMGIGVSSNVVAAAASLISCSILTAPFNYLGVKVGSNMSRITSWDDVISKVSSRLSKWKLKLLSIGGRFSLLKSVLTSIPLYHMSIFKVLIGVLNNLESIRRNFFYGVDGSDRKLAWIGWNMVLTSKKNGGLGVSSFFAHNHALLFKWVWRFLTDGSSLWTRFIKSIFGNKGALDTHKLIPRRFPWQDVILVIHSLQSKGEVALKVIYKRLYALEICKSISVAEKMGHPSLSHSFCRMPRGGVKQENYGLLCSKVVDLVLPNILDRWCWSIEGSQEFSVKSSRILIDTILPKAKVTTRWHRVVPIKELVKKEKEKLETKAMEEDDFMHYVPKRPQVITFTQAKPREYYEPQMSYSTPCGVEGIGAWDAECNIGQHNSHMTIVLFEKLGTEEPSVVFGRDFLLVTKPTLGFGLGERQINIGELEDDKDVDWLLKRIIKECGDEALESKTIKSMAIKFKELLKEKAILHVLENYTYYRRLLDEVSMDKKRLEMKVEIEVANIIEEGLPKKMDDPENYIVPLKVNGTTPINALANTGASVSVMPYKLYKVLGLGKACPSNDKLLMADNTVARAYGKVRNVRLQIGFQAYLCVAFMLDFKSKCSRIEVFRNCQYLSKKVVGLREASDINGGHYVSRIARNPRYFTVNETKNCLAPIEANEWRDAMLLRTGYQLDYALPILIHLGDECGRDFKVGTPSLAGTSMGNKEKQVVSRFSGANKRASYRLDDESTKSDDSEQSDNDDDDSNTDDDMDEERS